MVINIALVQAIVTVIIIITTQSLNQVIVLVIITDEFKFVVIGLVILRVTVNMIVMVTKIFIVIILVEVR